MWQSALVTLALVAGTSMAGIIRDHYADLRYVHQYQQPAAAAALHQPYAGGGLSRLDQSPAPIVEHPAPAAAAAPVASPDYVVADASKHEHKHEIKHKHATSHQTFKIHHFHAVPVYVKKEDQHLLKHPKEIGGVNHKLKQIHPEAVKSHGHGLVLENHTAQKLKHHHHSYDAEPDVGVKSAADQLAHLHDFSLFQQQQQKLRDDVDASDVGPLQFHDINVRSGGH